MSTRAFSIGIQDFAAKTYNWASDNFSAMLIDLTQADTAVKLITGVTNVSPMVVTATSHGFSNGDIVVQQNVGGNLAANGTFKVASVTTSTYALTNLDGGNTTGSAAYTSGGSAINLTLAATMNDVNAGRVGTDQALASKTNVGGLLNCAAITFPSVPTVSGAMIIYFNGGSDGASFPLFFIDGKMLVTFASAKVATSTAVDVQKLAGPLATAVAATTTAGVLVTSNASAAQFARSVTVLSLPTGGVSAGDHADFVTTGSGFPIPVFAGSVVITPDSAANKLFNLNAL
jgi:hypothetical protein